MNNIKLNILSLIEKEISQCKLCRLCEGRNKTVPGEGNINAKIVFCGEAPGKNEADTGKPFVGRAGKLLTKMIENMGLKREDVFILNAIKCRPPDNRKPEPDEIAACLHYLKMQLMVINAPIVVTLGASATDALLGPGEGITKRRGKIYHPYSDYNLIVIPTFHPSYLLRNQALKQEAAKDLSFVLKVLKNETEY